MRPSAFAFASVLLLAVSACGGGGGGGGRNVPFPAATPVQPDGGISTGTKTSLSFAITNGGTPLAHQRRKALDASSNAGGAELQVFAHSDTAHAHVLASSITDVSAGSAACVAGATARTCTVSVNAPVGSDDIVLSLYNAVPVNGAIPAGASLLTTETITETVTSTPAAPTAVNLIFISNATTFYASATQTLNTYPEGQQVLAIAEPAAGVSAAYTPTATGCTGILSVGTVVGSGTAATLLVVGGTTISQSGCALAISDGTVTTSVLVTNTLRAVGTPSVLHEYPTLAGEPYSIVTGSDGNLWFSEENGDSLSSIGPAGTGYTPHTLTGFVSPYGVALGGDGNVWVGDDNSNLVAKVTTAGVATAYSASNQWTNFTAAGLDGLTWFDECQGNHIGNLSTTGTLHELTTPSGEPQGITLGPDGAMWYAAQNKIGRIVGGVATEFTATSANDGFSIASGSDGAVWFGEGADIGRMDQSGNEHDYPLPASGSVNDIVAGPDGAMWFADQGNNAIGRITTGTSPTITEYPIPTANSLVFGITVGPDGNIWFTEEDTGNIGVLQL